jgi:ATP-dependent Lon protease
MCEARVVDISTVTPAAGQTLGTVKWRPATVVSPPDLAVRVRAQLPLLEAFSSRLSARVIRAEAPASAAALIVWKAFAGDPAGLQDALALDDLGEQLEAAESKMRHSIAQDINRPITERVAWAALPPDVRRVADREISAYRKGDKIPGAGVDRDRVERWLNTLLELPWGERYRVPRNTIGEARALLDKQHYGMEEPKRRMEDLVTDLLWWEQRRKTHAEFAGADAPKTQMLLFVGPFGTGKTTFAQSVADALDRPMGLIDCGGLKDSADLKGHGRTYVDSQYGAIVREVVAMQSTKGVLVFDEIDKMPEQTGINGNLMSVVMSVTDRKKNDKFADNYLTGVPIDLSNMLVILTANDISKVYQGLLDRCTVIEVNGYGPHDKITIARQYLLPRIRADKHLLDKEFDLTDEALEHVIHHYTAEAGVRGLIDQLQTLATRMKRRPDMAVPLGKDNVVELLSEPLLKLSDLPENEPGSVSVLYVGPQGGGVQGLQVQLVPEPKPTVRITGTVKEMPREMLEVATSWTRKNLPEWWKTHRSGEVSLEALDTHTVHMHANYTGMPKDGPSGGVATLMALTSSLTGCIVPKDIAMTGEINLEGRVLPVGGVPEKVIAAQRLGIRKVLIPEINARDIEKIPADVREAIEIVPISKVTEALEHCFGRGLVASSPVRSAPPVTRPPAAKDVTAATEPVVQTDVVPGAPRRRMPRPSLRRLPGLRNRGAGRSEAMMSLSARTPQRGELN